MENTKELRRRSASDVGKSTESIKRAFRIYWANDDHMYWTFLLDSTNTVGDVSEGLKSKVPSGHPCYLYKRTKGNFGRWKDRRLSNEDNVWDIVDKRRKNHKSDPIFVVKKKKSTSQSKKSPQIESESSPLNTSGEIQLSSISSSILNNGSSTSSSNLKSTMEFIPPPPTTSISQPSTPHHHHHQHNNSNEHLLGSVADLSTPTPLTPTSSSIPTGNTPSKGRPSSTSFIPGSVSTHGASRASGFINLKPVSPTSVSTPLVNPMSSSPSTATSTTTTTTTTLASQHNNNVVSNSSIQPQAQQQQQQFNNLPSNSLAANIKTKGNSTNNLTGSGGISNSNANNRSVSPSPFMKKNAGLDYRKNRLSMQDPSKDIMRLMRFYFGDSLGGNSESGGRFFTIAVHKDTTAKDVCISVEQKLQLQSTSIYVTLVLPISNGAKIERTLNEDEIIISVKDSWEDPSQTFFQVRENTQKQPINKRLSRQIQNEPHIIPSEWRRSTDAISLRASTEDIWKRKSIPIVLQVSNGTQPQSLSPSHQSLQYQQQQQLQQFQQRQIPPSPLSMLNGDDRDDSDDESDFDISALKGWVHWIPSADLEYIKRIGSGTYSKVYKGRYRDKFVAIKTMRGSNMTTEQIEGFKKECDVLSTIQSPFLISFYGSCIEESQLSMVVEYCSKGTLHKILNSPQLDFDWEKWFRWMTQVVEGVRYLHDMNPPMVHRDLKTLNILVSSDWCAKLCDFGLTRTMTMTNVSTLGMLRGTMAYTAPEIYDGLLFNTKSDVYSLGVIMWETVQRCLTGTYLRPFHDYPISMDIQIIIMTSKNKIRPKINEQCPEELKSLITRCWDEIPDKRPNCEEILDTLHRMKQHYDENKESWESLRTKLPSQQKSSLPQETSQTSSPPLPSQIIKNPPPIIQENNNNNLKENSIDNVDSNSKNRSSSISSNKPKEIKTSNLAVHHDTLVTEVFDFEDQVVESSPTLESQNDESYFVDHHNNNNNNNNNNSINNTQTQVINDHLNIDHNHNQNHQKEIINENCNNNCINTNIDISNNDKFNSQQQQQQQSEYQLSSDNSNSNHQQPNPCINTNHQFTNHHSRNINSIDTNTIILSDNSTTTNSTALNHDQQQQVNISG
eukprot:gene3313-4152_t